MDQWSAIIESLATNDSAIESIVLLQQCSKSLYAIIRSNHILGLLLPTHLPNDQYFTSDRSFWSCVYWSRCRDGSYNRTSKQTTNPYIEMRDYLKDCGPDDIIDRYILCSSILNPDSVMSNVLPYIIDMRSIVRLYYFISGRQESQSPAVFCLSVGYSLMTLILRQRLVVGDIFNFELIMNTYRELQMNGVLPDLMASDLSDLNDTALSYLIDYLQEHDPDLLNRRMTRRLLEDGRASIVKSKLSHLTLDEDELTLVTTTCIKNTRLDSIEYILSLGKELDWQEITRDVAIKLPCVRLLLSIRTHSNDVDVTMIVCSQLKWHDDDGMLALILAMGNSRVDWDNLYKITTSERVFIHQYITIRDSDIKYNGITHREWPR